MAYLCTDHEVMGKMASIANALQVEAWCPTCEASTTHVQSEDEDYYEECDNADC